MSINMKNIQIKNNSYLLCLAIIVFFSATLIVNAADDIDNVTMEIATKEAKRGHRIHMHTREIILDYMIKKGDLTVEEAENHKRKRDLQRNELKNLKQQGDMEAFKARLTEIKTEHNKQRKELEEYIKNNEELQQQLDERRSEHRERMKGKMHERHHKEKFFRRSDDNQERRR